MHWTTAMLRRAPGLLICFLLVGCSESPDEPVVTPVINAARDYVLRVTETTGEYIEERAQSFAEALNRLWRRLFPDIDRRVRVDPDDPLRGILQGIYVHSVVIEKPDGSKDTVTLRLIDPCMRRAALESEWQLDPAHIPDLVKQ